MIALIPGAAVRAAPQPSIHQLRAKVDNLANKAEVVTERYNGQKIKLAGAKREARRTQRRADEFRQRAKEAREQVGRIAAAQYKAGAAGPAIELVASIDNPLELAERLITFGQLSHQTTAKLENLRHELARSRQAAAEAERKADKVKEITKDLGRKKDRIEGLLAETKQQLAHLRALERQRQQQLEERQQARASRSAAAETTDTSPGSPTSSSADLGSGKGAAAAQAALTQVGDPYVWGAAGPDAYDCSGLVVWAYGQVGISLPHYTGALWTAGPQVSRSELQPGDLVFYYPDHHHVGIYVGNGKMVNAPHTGTVVQVEPVDGGGAYSGAVRVA